MTEFIETKVKISKKAEDALHRDHFVYGVIKHADGLEFITENEAMLEGTRGKKRG